MSMLVGMAVSVLGAPALTGVIAREWNPLVVQSEVRAILAGCGSFVESFIACVNAKAFAGSAKETFKVLLLKAILSAVVCVCFLLVAGSGISQGGFF